MLNSRLGALAQAHFRLLNYLPVTCAGSSIATIISLTRPRGCAVSGAAARRASAPAVEALAFASDWLLQSVSPKSAAGAAATPGSSAAVAAAPCKPGDLAGESNDESAAGAANTNLRRPKEFNAAASFNRC